MPKEDETVEISSHEYLTALKRWNEFWIVENEGKLYQAFHRFLGMHSAPGIKFRGGMGVGTIMLRASAARKVGLLCGPNHHAILAVYNLRNNP